MAPQRDHLQEEALTKWGGPLALVKRTALASIENSLSIGNGDELRVDLHNWITRSRARGGTAAEWDALEAALPTNGQHPLADVREEISVHQLDDVLRFWLKEVGDVSLREGWLEGHLRGVATYERLAGYAFFGSLATRARLGVA